MAPETPPPCSETPILAAENIVKQYPGAAVRALDGLNLCVAAGQIFGLLGPNGAGKTTAVSIMSTLMGPTAGQLRVLGDNALEKRGRIRRHIGLAPQEIALYEALSARENLSYFGRMYEPRYLSGMVAGKMTKKNVIGYVAAFPIPEVIRGINAFTLGVQSVNPQAEVRVVWTQTWFDPGIERDAADSLLDVGADVIAQHQDSPGPQEAAQEKGDGMLFLTAHLGNWEWLVAAQAAWGLDMAVITLDSEGMALVRKNGEGQVYSTQARSVYDITGAGDVPDGYFTFRSPTLGNTLFWRGFLVDGKPELLSTFQYIYDALGIESDEESEFRRHPITT